MILRKRLTKEERKKLLGEIWDINKILVEDDSLSEFSKWLTYPKISKEDLNKSDVNLMRSKDEMD